ncbi:hypothetical protein EAH68_05310 [Corynebacterium hylobatis]|uniref:Uncharacterized protein n=1 Tax=Corynebacterium hylobatis TaxID=1859290 RepID=A0A3R9ZF17_9CORY|nr:hypothetical protein [Corynebacterium hylobatis]RSZ64412.1 hypothetical protein EAH68_05310 [Corynebacterium hylobatis]
MAELFIFCLFLILICGPIAVIEHFDLFPVPDDEDNHQPATPHPARRAPRAHGRGHAPRRTASPAHSLHPSRKELHHV